MSSNQTSQKTWGPALFFAALVLIAVFFFFKNSKNNQNGRIIRVTSAMKEHFNDPSKLLLEAKVVPKLNSQNQVDCMEISEITENSVFKDLGLENNDCASLLRVVTHSAEIREFSLKDPSVTVSLYSGMQNAAKVDLILVRNEKDIVIHYLL
jgi:hypothetical protein